MDAVVNNLNMQAAAAEIFLLSAICAFLLIDVFLDDSKRWITYGLTMLTLVGCAFVTVNYAVDSRVVAFDGMFVADPMGEIILSIPDFAGNHNGGMIEFGKDGYLYIGTGDGGGGGDPCRNGQALDRTAASCTSPPSSCAQAGGTVCEPLLGKILRIDVNTTTGSKKYGIPTDNPFAAGGGEPEIYVIGLRNPWRWSFDRETGDLYIGDVGQGAQEEVTVLRAADGIAGKNLGWSMYEGSGCYGNYTCSMTGMTAPQVTKSSGGTDNWHSVIGGQVYRGDCFPDLKGYYFFTDYSARLVLPTASSRSSAFDRLVAFARDGLAVPLYVGNRWSPRHVVLVLPGDEGPDSVLIYDPARGRRYPIRRTAFVGADLDVAGWSTPWVVVSPD